MVIVKSYNSYYNLITKSWFVAEREDEQLYRHRAVDLLNDPDITDRVQVLEPERGLSTLRIKNLRLSDSAQYRFTFKSQTFEWNRSFPGTTLTVTDPDVQVICSPIGPTLTCHSSCLLSGRPSFVWYENGTEIHGETFRTFKRFLQPENNYSCSYELHHSSPVYAPKVPLVQLSQPGDILKDSSVSLTCSSDANPPPEYTWYKGNRTLFNRAAQLVFSSIRSSDSGEYYCTAENALGKTASKRVLINVKYAPQSSSVSVSPSGEIMEGSSVTLTCSSDANPAAHYTWYKENRALLQGPQGVYHLSSISSGDSGVYSCKSENQYGRINSTSLHLDVQYAPKPPSVSVSSSGEIMEGSSVTLTCSSDANPAANYTWYKRSGDKQVQRKASGQNFTITDIISEHGGKYQCEAQNTHGRSNTTLHLTVGAGAWKSAVTGTTTALLLVVVLLAVFLWIRRNKSFTQQRECGERPEDRVQIPAAAHTRPAEPHDDVHYASVCFTQNPADAIYCNIGRVQPQRETDEDEEEEAEYSAVRFDSATGTRREEEGDDPSALYSTVTKH
ncbi:B-cell receptor CD22-like [Limanda limanda]|uniref:B-cell receptor CD22-like n=1 Tax=Limanda limanda TaxID=27771 RepID=UPI0029C69924|nr:B-cell receptor CD22-like [Limanda limanda]